MKGTLFNFLLTVIHVSLLLYYAVAVNQKKGFSMKMIYRDSKESPLYPGNHLTRDERIQRLVKQSKARARYIKSQILFYNNATRSINPDIPRLPVVYEPGMWYVAMIGLGTFPGRRQSFLNYPLMIDTCSDYMWLQCEGAKPSFTQEMPLYPWNLSTTYSPVPCNMHPFCGGDKCNVHGECTYISRYVSGSVTSGIVAKEIFTLSSATGGLESTELYFGCGFDQRNFETLIGDNHKDGEKDLIAGILGLGSGQWSFINQLGGIGQGKFSHCFETFNPNIEGSDTYLRFGADATIGGIAGQEVHVTPFVVPKFRTSLYYLNLENISVGNKSAEFPRGTFELNSQGKGGTTIDSGTPLSMMYKDHFDIVANLVKAHFKELGIDYIGSQNGLDVCFRLPGRFDTSNYPSITLHFQQGANYVISDYKANFVMISVENVCLGIERKDTNMPAFILGAMQQTNKRILYNIKDMSLSFATEYCELGS